MTELYVTVEVYVPKSASSSRKLARKKTEKRESVRPLTATLDGGSKKVKEKSSWLGLPSRSSGGNDPWRTATCKLVSENNSTQTTISIFLDESKLYHSVHINKLFQTDIRPVHHSLVDRKNCLGIYCEPAKNTFNSNITEPLYLHFATPTLMHTWLSLLRSFAEPETYGRKGAGHEGGLYRMWRQVKLTCISGRNLGASRSQAEDNTSGDPDSKSEGDAIDLDVYCEVFINNILCGRTTVRKCVGSPDWNEAFTFPDLAPFENMEVVVYRERKLVKPIVLGSFSVYLTHFRRGESVEGWFPVVNNTGAHVGVQLGELRLKLRVDEEIILPSNAYAAMHRAMQARNYLDWIADFESKLKLKDVIDHVMSIAQAHDVLIDNIMDLANREVDGTHSTHNTLFRGNTVFTKTMEVFMWWYGSDFLEASLGPVIRRLCTEKVMIEIDPGRSTGRHGKDIDRSVNTLVYWCNEFWNAIYEARNQCPSELRTVFAHVRHLVETRYVTTDEQKQESKDLPWQSVSSFLFLRFMVPAILHPHLFEIWPGLNDEPVRRSLTLIAKVMQSLANLNTSVQKEDFMHAVKDFLAKSSNTMMDYIMVVSTPQRDQSKPKSATTKEERALERDQLGLQNFLSQRTSTLFRLNRESITMPPHMLDVPRHYASLASLIVRHSRKSGYNFHSPDPADAYFDNLCIKSIEVEEQALARVSELAGKPPSRRDRRPSTRTEITSNPPLSPSTSPPSLPTSPGSSASASRDRTTSLQSQSRRSRRGIRPQTAPDESGTRQSSPEEFSGPSSPTMSNGVSRMLSRTSMSSRTSNQHPTSTEDGSMEGEPRSLPSARPSLVHHPRSTSTDSALFRKSSTLNASSSSSVSHVLIEANPPDDDKKKKGILRGILRR
ncbi:hypothetical protein EIP91_008915 [Steccherinum ochraceum]|uniref:Uncharacterized protein n=1 Tax=Steccherinum ochraceum TaxID=92696 RepID=A0A4R0S3W3_9APHY|nr:hypothetical protein EIP91_008915 [Steccherinum ochraceum]